jgi:ceramide glucosyltransferase
MNKSFRDSMLHQIRWMKSSKHTRPKGHLGTGLTFAVPFGLLGLVAGAFSAQWALGIAMFATAYLNRVVQSILVGWGVTRDARSLRHASLYPLRDLMGFFFWMISYSGNVVEWRGERYRLEEQGRMVRVD